MYLSGLLFLNFILWIHAKAWLPEDIKNPLTNPEYCNVKDYGKSLICDPDNLLKDGIKNEIIVDLLINIPQRSPCFCDAPCDKLDYTRRLMLGVVIIQSIESSIQNCSNFPNVLDCFSERVLQNWNISRCNGNNGLILVFESKIHLYFGNAVRDKMSKACVRRLYSTIRPYVLLNINLRLIFKEITRILKKPCLCSDSCTFHHLKWLTNIVFFMGVIVLVTCIGGMSRRAMLAKFHQRSFSSRHLFGDYIIRRRPSLVRPTVDHSVDNRAVDVQDNIRPPEYSTLEPLPKPPPYIPVLSASPMKDASSPRIIVPNNVPHQVAEGRAPPPSYELAIDGNFSSPHTTNTDASLPPPQTQLHNGRDRSQSSGH